MCETRDATCEHPACESLVRVDTYRDECAECKMSFCQMHLVKVHGATHRDCV